jgi:hypothetical protein
MPAFLSQRHQVAAVSAFSRAVHRAVSGAVTRAVMIRFRYLPPAATASDVLGRITHRVTFPLCVGYSLAPLF